MRLAILLVLVTLAIVPSASASRDLGAAGVTPPSGRYAPSTAPSLRASAPKRCDAAWKAIRWYSARYGHWMVLSGHASPRAVSRPHGCAYARWKALRWKERAATARAQYNRWLFEQKREHQHPKWIALRLLRGDREQWSCLLYITDRENKTMDPTLDYGGGHGNVYEAYGIPQANPGTKMASAGSDWRTNPETQLRWMIQYCRDRYGSVCGAAYSRRVYGTY